MVLKIIKPVTPGQRILIKIINKNLKKSPLLKTKGIKKSLGRNNSGKITSYYRGSGHKRKYRFINFNKIFNFIGIVVTFEYDPNRTAYICVIYDLENRNYFYIIAAEKLLIGDIIKSGLKAQPKLGHCLPLLKIPIGSLVYNISCKLKNISQISRSAGTFSQLIKKTPKYCKLKVSSGQWKIISSNCCASIGCVSNELHFLKTLGKAGRSRWLNKRPNVRGVAMNPVDHPNGGGEGKKSGKKISTWGKTRNKNKVKNQSNLIKI